MMNDINHKIPKGQHVIRCFNIVSKESDIKFGQVCDQRLLHKNSDGKVAGEIKCPRCKALYEIQDDKLILKERS
jgi:hypothetical protein